MTIETLRFILSVLVDYNPVTGQAEFDFLQFPEVFVLYRELERDSTVKASESHVREHWRKLLAESDIHMRLHKSVSKCERCIQLRISIRKVRNHT